MILDQASYAAFAETLLGWYAQHGRKLPWRDTYEPYRVWIAEVMLQQTQMERGAAFFERWMKRFPDIAAVAAANEEEILKAWEGLGYYSRARNLHRAARIVMERHKGVLPSQVEVLRALPGVGDYTAAAVASIGFNRPFAAIDANAERVFARLLDIDSCVKSRRAHAFIATVIESCQPPGKVRFFNEAVMELGALVCVKKPRCAVCPVRVFCEAKRLGVEESRPILREKRAREHVEIVTGVLSHEGRFFIQKRPPVGVWADMWEFPGGSMEKGENEAQALAREFCEETEIIITPVEKIADISFTYTRFQTVMHAWRVETKRADGIFPLPRLHAAVAYAWVTPDELDRYALPSGMRKLVRRLRERKKEEELL